MTGEQLSWRALEFGAAPGGGGSSCSLHPLKGVALLPLPGGKGSVEAETPPDPALSLPGGSGVTQGPASLSGPSEGAEDPQALLLWHYLEPLLQAYLFGEGVDWQQADADGGGVGGEKGGGVEEEEDVDADAPLTAALKPLQPLLDRLVRGICPPVEAAMSLSGVPAFLEEATFDDSGALADLSGALQPLEAAWGQGGSTAGSRLPSLFIDGRSASGIVIRHPAPPGEETTQMGSLKLLKAALPDRIREILFLGVDLERRAVHPMDIDGPGDCSPEIASPPPPPAAAQDGLLAERLRQMELLSGPVRISPHRLLYFLATRAIRPAKERVGF